MQRPVPRSGSARRREAEAEAEAVAAGAGGAGASRNAQLEIERRALSFTGVRTRHRFTIPGDVQRQRASDYRYQ